VISIILSGGSGTRLWPLSRKKLPKQFSPLFAETLFQKTVNRLRAFGDVGVCTSEDFRGLTERSVRDLDLKLSPGLYEPCPRNTAPAVALVCKSLLMAGRGEDVVGIFPADHWVDKPEVFHDVITEAQESAKRGSIVTLGIRPTYAATGFGYVEIKGAVANGSPNLQALEVAAFREKPDSTTAAVYQKSGKHFWNSGMFVFKVSTMVDAFLEFMPTLWQKMDALESDFSNLADIYQSLDGESLDYGIMEKAQNQVCIPCDIGWSDLGSWDDIQAFASRLDKGHNGAEVFSQNAKGNFAFSTLPKTVCFLGVDDLQVVETSDVTFIGKAGCSQDVRALLETVKKEKPHLAVEHTFEQRPWGDYQNLYEDPKFKVKVIVVDPRQQLSYQSHQKRSEIWVVVEGRGEVVLNDKTVEVSPGKVVEIPQLAKHRMRNSGDKPLKFVEVQQGSYFGEDDITRYQDDYNRIKS